MRFTDGRDDKRVYEKIGRKADWGKSLEVESTAGKVVELREIRLSDLELLGLGTYVNGLINRTGR